MLGEDRFRYGIRMGGLRVGFHANGVCILSQEMKLILQSTHL
jgi:hypothetical protein